MIRSIKTLLISLLPLLCFVVFIALVTGIIWRIEHSADNRVMPFTYLESLEEYRHELKSEQFNEAIRIALSDGVLVRKEYDALYDLQEQIKAKQKIELLLK